MKLLILSLTDAVTHKPTRQTYAIRISSPGLSLAGFPLADSCLYSRIREYYFDDIEPSCVCHDDVLFDSTMAEMMLRDFQEHKGCCKSLLVHCSRGRNRSPAVGMAFNEIFGFGYDPDKLKGRYPDANMHVYNVLKEAAKKL